MESALSSATAVRDDSSAILLPMLSRLDSFALNSRDGIKKRETKRKTDEGGERRKKRNEN